METGLLWYDGDPVRDLAQKVRRAARRCRQKFGVAPDVCHVHPSMMEGINGELTVGGVRVLPNLSILRHHFWIGQEQQEADNG